MPAYSTNNPDDEDIIRTGGSLGPGPDALNSHSISRAEEFSFFEETWNWNESRLDRSLAIFGWGRLAIQARKAYVGLLFKLVWSIVQVIVVVTMVTLSRSVFKDPQDLSRDESSACNAPLDTWAILWVVRTAVSTLLSYWKYMRELDAIDQFISGDPVTIKRGDRTFTMPRSNYDRKLQTIQQQGVILPTISVAYTRLSTLSSILTLSWFVVAHVLEATSISTCRHTSPHIWWLVFGLLCIVYLMIFRVVIVAIFVLIITPAVFFFWNILLFCWGRHPTQITSIKHDIEKLPKAFVDKIPLVMYIPPPPEGSDLKPSSLESCAQAGTPTHSRDTTVKPVAKARPHFRFLEGGKSEAKGTSSTGTNFVTNAEDLRVPGGVQPLTWSEYWQRNKYPFVVLEDSRAACAICLADFQVPNRKVGLEHPVEKKAGADERAAVADANGNSIKDESSQDVKIGVVTNGHGQTKISSGSWISAVSESAGRRIRPQKEKGGPKIEPLRLLTCGHVFHRMCLDPWLTDVSGRCPVCQRPVEIAGQEPSCSQYASSPA